MVIYHLQTNTCWKNMEQKYKETSDGVYYLSDLDYSTRQTVLNTLKKDQYKDIVNLKHIMKLTTSEIKFIFFEN